MKVIFVASGNKKGGSNVSAFVQSQYDSLRAEGLEMRLLSTEGKGIQAYLRAAWKLRKMIRTERPDVIHAHYSLCGWVASIACIGLCKRPKIVVSILGSFPTKSKKWKLVRWSVKHLWDVTIVKSKRTADQLGLPVEIIPNGVNLEMFKTMNHIETRERVGFDKNKRYVIWCSNPERPEKNWALAQAGVRELVNEGMNVELVAVYAKKPSEVATYMNAADCLLLTSVSEGSPNVIKEAMACNCPIVTTDVGDVRERLANLDGCYIVSDNESKKERVRAVGIAIAQAIKFGKRTEGRKRILEDELEISQISRRIIKIYTSFKL